MICKLGFLSPEGVLTECVSWGHLSKAEEICKQLGIKTRNGVEAEQYLMNKGYIVVRAQDVYGLIGYKNNEDTLIYLTPEQKKWLEDNYSSMPPEKQKSVDYMIDVLNRK